MFAQRNEPLLVVERLEFARLLVKALPHYKMLNRTVSVTSDIWTCLHNNASFLSFTAHWLAPKFQL